MHQVNEFLTTTLLLHFKAFSTLYEINLWWSSADYHDTGHQRRRPSQRRHDSPTASAFGFLLLLVTSRERLRSWCGEASLSSHYCFRSKDRWSMAPMKLSNRPEICTIVLGSNHANHSAIISLTLSAFAWPCAYDDQNPVHTHTYLHKNWNHA